jgi:hypothetical protein
MVPCTMQDSAEAEMENRRITKAIFTESTSD